MHLANAPYPARATGGRGRLDAAKLRQAASGETVIDAARVPATIVFRIPAWRKPPFHFLEQAFLLAEQWWADAAAGPPGVNAGDRRVVAFGVRQWVDMFSPSNVPWLNPEVLRAARETGGARISLPGAANFVADLRAAVWRRRRREALRGRHATWPRRRARSSFATN